MATLVQIKRDSMGRFSVGGDCSVFLKKSWKNRTNHHREKMRAFGLTRTAEKAGGWKGDSVGYSGIHHWLNNTFGKASRCENKECLKRSKYFVWALLRKKKYERKRENFIMLCNSCHMRYDLNKSFQIWP